MNLCHLLSSFKSSLPNNLKPLPDMPILGSSDSAANKDMVAKMWINGDTINCLSRKIMLEKEKLLGMSISPFPTMFSRAVCC